MLHRHRFNKVRPGKMADIFQTIFTFLNEHMWNSIQISWKCISRVAIKNIPELVQIMAAPLSLNGLIIFTISRPVKQPWRIDDEINVIHYSDVIMSTIACLSTSLAVVYSTVYSDADQRKHQSSASLAFVRGIHRDRWIPRTKGQLRGKCFHLMTSSC